MPLRGERNAHPPRPRRPRGSAESRDAVKIRNGHILHHRRERLLDGHLERAPRSYGPKERGLFEGK